MVCARVDVAIAMNGGRGARGRPLFEGAPISAPVTREAARSASPAHRPEIRR